MLVVVCKWLILNRQQMFSESLVVNPCRTLKKTCLLSVKNLLLYMKSLYVLCLHLGDKDLLYYCMTIFVVFAKHLGINVYYWSLDKLTADEVTLIRHSRLHVDMWICGLWISAKFLLVAVSAVRLHCWDINCIVIVYTWFIRRVGGLVFSRYTHAFCRYCVYVYACYSGREWLSFCWIVFMSMRYKSLREL